MKKYLITIFLLLVFLQMYAILEQNETTEPQNTGFILDVPTISDPYFKWGLRNINNDNACWVDDYGINFKEYEVIYGKSLATNINNALNFTTSIDTSVFVAKETNYKTKLTIQIGLLGFSGIDMKENKLNFFEQPSNIAQKKQGLTDLLVDAVKSLKLDDTENIYVICDQSTDKQERLANEKARCLVWRKSVIKSMTKDETVTNKKVGFMVNMPAISDPNFRWGLNTTNKNKPWWENEYGVNFKEHSLIYYDKNTIDNFITTKDDKIFFKTKETNAKKNKTKNKATVQVGLIGFSNISKHKLSKKLKLSFLKQPNDGLAHQQPLTNLLADAIEYSNVSTKDFENTYVICDQATDIQEQLAAEEARCIVWYNSIAKAVPQKKTTIPANYHYYYVQVSAKEFGGRKALIKKLFKEFEKLKQDSTALYHLYISNGNNPIIANNESNYATALNKLHLLEPSVPSIGFDRNLILEDIGGAYNKSYMRKLYEKFGTPSLATISTKAEEKIDANIAELTQDEKKGQCYFHYYLSDDLKKTKNIYELIGNMFASEDKQLDNITVYMHTKSVKYDKLFYEKCELELHTCDRDKYNCK